MTDKRIPRGVQNLINESQQDNLLSSFQLYLIYSKGEFGIDKNENEAIKYFERCKELTKKSFLVLKELKLRNFRAIENLDIDFDDRLTVIVGKNGSGKTSILDAIAQNLSWIVSRALTATGRGSRILDYDLRYKSDYTEISTSFALGKTTASMSTSRANTGYAGRVTGDLQLSESIGQMYRELSNHDSTNIPLMAFYSVNRTIRLSSSRQFKVSKGFSRMKAFDDSLSSSSNLEWFFSNYIIIHNLANHSNEKEKYQKLLLILNKVLNSAIEGVSNFHVDRPDGHDAIFVTVGDSNIEVLQLSDGQKVLLALIGDIALRLIILNNGLNNPIKEGHGIILIDEIELHLHPAWQRNVISSLMNTFISCQFIVTTHSSQIPGEVSSKQIRILSISDDNKIVINVPERSYGLSTSEVLQELMDARDINIEVEKQINFIFEMIDKDDFSEAHQKIAELKAKLKGTIPKLIEADSLLKMLED